MAPSSTVDRLLYHLSQVLPFSRSHNFQLYFVFVNFIFWAYNEFLVKRERVAMPESEILLLSATKLAKKIRDRELTSSEVLEAFIARIETVDAILFNDHEFQDLVDKVNAIAFKHFDEARKAAKLVDDRLAKLSSKECEKLAEIEPLLGVPVSIKNNLDVEDWKSDDGSFLRKDYVATSDAEVVARVRAAGAILYVITNCPEACIWVETSNVLHGQTRNPHDLRRSAGGSSGGEGALIGAAGSVVGIGNDLGGSIRIPAANNGVFGLKPGPGLISIKGVVPEFPDGLYMSKMATNGPLCRYAEDLELMMKVCAYRDALEKPLIPLEKLRFFYIEGFHSPYVEELNEDLREALQKTAEYFRRHGHFVESLSFDELDWAPEIFGASIQDLPEGSPTLWDVAGNMTEKISPFTDFPKALLGQSHHSPEVFIMPSYNWYFNAKGERKEEIIRRREYIKAQLLERLGNDGILLFPGFSSVADYHSNLCFKPANFVYTGIFNALLLPVVMCPVGKNAEGIPLSLQVVGPERSELLLIEVAKEIENAFGGWSLA